MHFLVQPEVLSQAYLRTMGHAIHPQQVRFFEATVPYLEMAYHCGAAGTPLTQCFPWLCPDTPKNTL